MKNNLFEKIFKKAFLTLGIHEPVKNLSVDTCYQELLNTCNVTVAKKDKLRPGISDYAIDSSWLSNASLTVASGDVALLGSAIVWALADIVAEVAEVGRDAGLADAGLDVGFDGAWDVSPKFVS